MDKPGPGRKTIMVRLDYGWWVRLRGIIFHTGKDRTIQALCASAIRRMITDIEQAENDGHPFAEVKVEKVTTVKKPKPK